MRPAAALEPRAGGATLFDLPHELKAFQERVRHVAQTEIAPHAAETDRTERYPWHCVEVLKREGFMGMTIPVEHGGRGASYLQAVILIEEMAKACSSTGRICVESNMGALGAIMKYGADAQKRLAAALVLAGDKPAILITEPDAGSAATEMTTRADHKGDRYILNGKKHWITGGGVSRLHLVFARMYRDGKEQGIAGFIVVRDPDSGAPKGLVIGKREPAMGVRGIPETEVLFEDLEVAEDMVVIPPQGVRKGFAGLMDAYNGQRVGAGTVALGIAESAYELALDYARKRRQFGRPIAEFQGLQWMLADMSIQLAAAQALIYKAAARAGEGFPDKREAAEAKIFASETAVRVTNDALQIHGAMGYSRNLALERKVRDARMFPIAGGTAQILRTQVAGAILGIRTPQARDGYLKLGAGE
ncbi:MAG TPA: 3-sulfinopropanoyl-CoA desulfinase [Burkholderiales bacterium]|nr:3-sulfinopropanoyl-CoA desulfinase [Burkholderiales bacterium]